MDNRQIWVRNLCQRLEAVCQEVDGFVKKDTVKYVENHMQTVGESVKKFYSGVVQDILPPLVDPVQHVAQLIPSQRIDLVETCTSSVVGIKENTVDSNTDKSDEGPFVPTEKCHKPSTTGLCHPEQISCAISGYPVGEADTNSYFQHEGDNLINKTSGKAVQVHLNSATSSQENFMMVKSPCKDASSPNHKSSSEAFVYSRCIDEKCDDDHSGKISHESSEDHLDNRSFEEEGMLCNTSPESDVSVFEDADWGIENIIDLDLGIDKKRDPFPYPSEDVNVSAHRILFAEPFVEEKSEKVPTETLVNGLGIRCSQEKKTLLNSSIDEFECDLNTSTAHQSSELESSIACNENKEKACHIFAGGFSPAKSYESSNLSLRNSSVEPDTIYCSHTKSMGCFSVSLHSYSSCESFAALGSDNNNDSTRLASSSYALSDDATRTDEAISGTGLCRSEHGRYCDIAQFEASVSCSEIGAEDGSTVDVKDLNMDTIDLSDKKQLGESCVIVEGEKPFAFPYGSRRSKSYKKIIQDSFTLRKRLTKEYKQLAIWYGDIDKEFSQPTEENALPPNMGTAPKSPAQDLCDSEWELV